MKQILSFTGRFSALHLAAYSIAALLFLAVQEAVPHESRTALDFYMIYRNPGFRTLAVQLLRAVLLALLLYRFRDFLVWSKQGPLALFGVLWGLTVLGSVEPMPGSIEGMVYTTSGAVEHLLVLAVTALQTMLFIRAFTAWERKTAAPGTTDHSELTSPVRRMYCRRFTAVHVVTYWVVGSIMYEIFGYEEALESMEYFELWRNLESIGMVIAVFSSQFFRGFLLAVCMLPFAGAHLNEKQGWIGMFLLIYGTTALGSPIFLDNLLVFDTSWETWVAGFLTGIPEITLQMALFAVLLTKWMRRGMKKHRKACVLAE